MNYQINNMLDDFENNIHEKIIRTKIIVNESINGPIGASKQVEFNPEKVKIKFNKEMDKFINELQLEIDKLNNEKEKVNEILNNCS